MAIKIQDALKNNEIAIGYLILTYVLTKIISSDDIFLSMRSMVLTSSNCKLLTSQIFYREFVAGSVIQAT